MTNNDIIKGGQLMLYIDGVGTIAFATSHTLSLTRNTQEISTKDHGDASAVLPTTQSWEITSENLMSTDGFATVLGAYLGGSELLVIFGMTNYAGYPDQEDGIVGTQDVWTMDSTWSSNVAGYGYITSATVNANAGENATMSITIQGSGPIAPVSL